MDEVSRLARNIAGIKWYDSKKKRLHKLHEAMEECCPNLLASSTSESEGKEG